MKARKRSARKRIMELLHDTYPQAWTDKQIQAVLGIPGDTERPRRSELVADRIIEAGSTRHGEFTWQWVPGAGASAAF
jgi:hypothetical protein